MEKQESYGKILIIEDNLGDARLVEIFLEQTNLIHFESIVHCYTLRDAFEQLEKETFAAVLLDIHLPDSHGISTLEELLDRFPEINVILMTGYNDRQIGLQAIQKGAQDFLVKGEFKAAELAKTINYSIERNKIIKRLEETQRTTNIGHWEIDLQAKSFIVSEEVYRIFGTSSKETSINYEFALSLIHPDDVEEAKAMANKLFEEKVTVKKDLRIIRRNDEQGYISLTAKIVNVVDGKVTKISGVLQDITKVKLNELEILKGKERYQNIFNSSKDAIYVKQKTGGFLDFNEASKDLFGYTDEELNNIDYNSLFVNPEKRIEFERIIESGESVSDFPIAIVTKNGEEKNCLLTANQMRPEEMTGYHQSVLSYHVIIRDISDALKAEKFKKEKEIAERQSKMKEELLANVSHEMRTPMNAIFGFANLLLDDNLKDEQQKLVKLIKDSSSHLMKIINDILDVSKQTKNDIEFEEAPIDFKTMVMNLEDVFSNPSKDKNISFSVEYDSELPDKIIGDPVRINQVLLNLCNNAVKFTEEGYVKLSATKLAETDEDVSIRVAVKDTGIGIQADKLPIIFQPFTRVANSKKKLYEGTGLGLSIIKAVVEQQGGTIDVKSEFGKGSEFSFDLTFKKFEISNGAEISNEANEFEEIDENPIQILLVEDNNLNQMVAKKTIMRQWPNATVDIAPNGKIAIEQIVKQEYDVVLMDIQMPVMDGIEATKCIRETLDSPKCDVSIIAMTAHKNVKDDEKHFQYKMDDCILKPFEPKELYSIIYKYTSKKENMERTHLSSSSTKYVDFTYMDLYAEKDEEFKKSMIEGILNDTPPHVATMNQLSGNGQWEELQKVSHLLKTSFPFIGNPTLTKSNETIDKTLKLWKDEKISDDEVRETVPPLVETVCEYFNYSIKEIYEEYLRLGGGAILEPQLVANPS